MAMLVYSPLALQNLPACGLTALPAGALQLRLVLFLDRPAEAKVGNERPALRHPQLLCCRDRVEDRHPTDPKAAGTRRQL